jgi:hypothetical protein
MRTKKNHFPKKNANKRIVVALEPSGSVQGGEALRDTSDQIPAGNSPTIISRRDEFKPINADKSVRRIPETFIK